MHLKEDSFIITEKHLQLPLTIVEAEGLWHLQ